MVNLEIIGLSREEHIMRKFYNARYLEPVLTEGEIVHYLSRHFEEDIRKVIVIQRIETIDSLVEYIRAIDEDIDGRRGYNFRSAGSLDEQNDNKSQNRNNNYRQFDNRNDRRLNNNYRMSRYDNNNRNYDNQKLTEYRTDNRFGSNKRYESQGINNNYRDNQYNGKQRDQQYNKREGRQFVNKNYENNRQSYAQVSNVNVADNSNRNCSQSEEIQTIAQIHSCPQGQDF